MKKLAIGCLVVLVLLGVAGSLVAYYVYHTVRAKFGDSIGVLASFKNVPDLERQVRNTADFTPPASDVLTAAQVNRLVAVQTAVRTKMGTDFSSLEQRYKTLIDKKEATVLDMPELIAAYGDLAKIWLTGKQMQIDALNAQGFSLAEYRWVRDRTYRAVGMPLADLDVAEIIEKAMRGEAIQPPSGFQGSIGPSGPAENQALIAGVKKALEENAALAMFGL